MVQVWGGRRLGVPAWQLGLSRPDSSFGVRPTPPSACHSSPGAQVCLWAADLGSELFRDVGSKVGDVGGQEGEGITSKHNMGTNESCSFVRM